MSYRDIKEEPYDEEYTKDTYIEVVSIKREEEINSHFSNLEFAFDTRADEFYKIDTQSSFLTSNASDSKDSQYRRERTKIFKCTYCNYRTDIRANLLKHLKHTSKHSNLDLFKCLKCKFLGLDQNSLIEHITNRHRSTELKCLHCDFVGKDKSSVSQHVNLHHTPKKFECLHCKYKTVFHRQLILHSKVNHNPKFTCSQCAFMGKGQIDLKRHVDSVHSPIKLKCPHCDFVGDNSIINGHIKVCHQLDILLNLPAVAAKQKTTDV